MKRCPACGALTIAERQTCKVCGALLPLVATEPQGSSRWMMSGGCFWRVLFILTFIVLAPILLRERTAATLRDPNYIPTPRGSMILMVRTPANQVPVRDLDVSMDGTIMSGTLTDRYVTSPRPTLRKRVLDAQARATVIRFRDAWCARDPQVYQPTTQTPAYGLGIRCPAGIETAHIAPSALPEALQMVVEVAYPAEEEEGSYGQP